MEKIQIRQNYEHFMRAFVGITPTLARTRVEEVCHQTIRLTRYGILFFEHAGSLKFSQTFQLVA
jgi:hypothetical protein